MANNVTLPRTTGTFVAGGLVGGVNDHISIVNSYASGNITAKGQNSTAGGLCGEVQFENNGYTKLESSYASGNVTADFYAGGLVAFNMTGIANCYAYGNVNAKYAAPLMYGSVPTYPPNYRLSTQIVTGTTLYTGTQGILLTPEQMRTRELSDLFRSAEGTWRHSHSQLNNNGYPVHTYDPPTVVTAIVPNGATGKQYMAIPFEATGTPAIAWSINDGSIPPGLQLLNSKLEGTPTLDGTYIFTVRAANIFGYDEKEFTVTIIQTPTITTTVLPRGVLSVSYNYALL